MPRINAYFSEKNYQFVKAHKEGYLNDLISKQQKETKVTNDDTCKKCGALLPYKGAKCKYC